jgi:hypothetical protein
LHDCFWFGHGTVGVGRCEGQVSGMGEVWVG